MHWKSPGLSAFHGTQALKAGETSREEILHLLCRRPCSIDDIVDGLGRHRNEVLKAAEHLHTEGLVELSQVGGTWYYKAVEKHRPFTP